MSKVDSGKVFLKFNNSFIFYLKPLLMAHGSTEKKRKGWYSQLFKDDWQELEDFKGG